MEEVGEAAAAAAVEEKPAKRAKVEKEGKLAEAAAAVDEHGTVVVLGSIGNSKTNTYIIHIHRVITSSRYSFFQFELNLFQAGTSYVIWMAVQYIDSNTVVQYRRLQAVGVHKKTDLGWWGKMQPAVILSESKR